MSWYQIFEYAVGHWMQKATEHIIGCVLCSPGCFSLFRASALMDHNVMARYTTRATEARHYVQYDQGFLYFTICVQYFDQKIFQAKIGGCVLYCCKEGIELSIQQPLMLTLIAQKDSTSFTIKEEDGCLRLWLISWIY